MFKIQYKSKDRIISLELGKFVLTLLFLAITQDTSLPFLKDGLLYAALEFSSFVVLAQHAGY